MQLRVKPRKRKDAGTGLAAIDRETMDDLGVSSGEFVAVDGPDGRVVARVWPGPAEDTGRGIVRIDGQLRKAAGARIDDPVSVEPADVEGADRVTIALPENVRVRGDLGSYLRDKLSERAVSPGDRLSLSLGFGLLSTQAGRQLPITVVDTEPSGTVVVGADTEIDVEVADRDPDELAVEAAGPLEGDGAETPTVTYEDVGGLDQELEQVREMIELPMRHPELFRTLGIEPPKGVLLHGPPGTGKTLIARAVANEIDAHFRTISGPEIMSKYYGESEEQLREVFEEAAENEPAIVFIDELDSIAPKREEVTGDTERRVVAQLLSLMDGLEDRGEITVIGTTNRVDAIDPALRRPGRFDREIEIGVPDRDGREEILGIHSRGMPLADEVDLERLAENTHGFVGADLENLAKEAAMTAMRRVRPDLDLDQDEIDAETLEEIEVTVDDFKSALRGIEPSAMREVFVEVPDVTWDDVGGLAEAKERLRESIQWPMEHADAYERVDLEPAKGVLLYGPPGTGKTLLAKAVANEAESNFISVKGPELFDKYVGESEKGVREVFSTARENAPTVIFFDEIDAIASERGSGVGDSDVAERVVSQLLTELDGLEELEDVVVVAATNRPDLIDDALLRPGRLDRHVEVAEPDEEARREILEIHTRDRPLADDVDLADLAAETAGYTGADLEAVCREAATIAVRDHVRAEAEGEDRDVDEIELTGDHFERALEDVSPESAAEFETGPSAGEFDEFLEGAEAETGTEAE
ncbi:transitional endoplasmic reticulum ATPase [Halobiforma haloterrestris]|uniref:Transitional endoplasmic reticulum ATPase n=1 Tax=Natronobacterium haloterrestre TaxID=148448 RepID=A0A1I1G7F7_NATHA|nr:CDC48 family AAA ATPase [Halobiforma haloterrestris]SFC05130.1 transitional endoplasmic reticulum ATPase [Halobiforma haloterrestris]